MPERFEITFSVDFIQAWQRAGTNFKTKKHFTKQATRDAEYEIGIAYKGASIKKYGKVVSAPQGVPVAVKVDCYTRAPKGWPVWLPRWLKPRMPFTKLPDADNLLKAVLDGLNGIAYEDDRQVIAAHVFKHDMTGETTDKTVVTIQFDSQS